MTKADIVNEISQNTRIERVTVQKAVETFMVTVKDSLVDGKNVYLRGFGSMVVKKRAEKTEHYLINCKEYIQKHYDSYSCT